MFYDTETNKYLLMLFDVGALTVYGIAWVVAVWIVSLIK